MNAVVARGLSVGRGAAPVLAGVDLAVRAGERLALVGGNGAGKTTLLRALAGIDPPRGGVIRWAGGPLPRGPARVGAVGVLLQTEPPSGFDVRTMVGLGLALDGPPPPPARRRIEAALDEAGLGALADRACTTLSGGEAQQTRLARALIAGPGLLCLDEPTTHLDPARQARLVGALDRLRGAVAVVLASHDLGLAATCDRIALLGRGRVVAIGAPAEVMTPAHLADALGIAIRRLDDPDGGPPLYRVIGVAS